ncbi:hypothetical protein BASA83_006632 [Batrachochytrium salamandrivorans]|nr:hypothetical protein BASA83_006632 [Batrachochytrium salamandrivorans]
MSPRSTAAPQNTVLDSHNGPRRPTTHIIQRLSAKASKPTGVFGKTTDIAVQTSLDQQPHLHHYHGRSLAVNVANISNKRPAIRHIVRNTRLWAISETCITSSKFRFTVPGFDVIQHPATGPGRRGIALGIPSCFGGHEHGSAVGTMILAKVPNFTPECLWIVGSVYHAALLTSPRVGQTDSSGRPLVIRTSIRAEAQGQPPSPRAPTISRHHCLEATDRIATSNYWDVLADGACNRH